MRYNIRVVKYDRNRANLFADAGCKITNVLSGVQISDRYFSVTFHIIICCLYYNSIIGI